jgi:hypothetical protein
MLIALINTRWIKLIILEVNIEYRMIRILTKAVCLFHFRLRTQKFKAPDYLTIFKDTRLIDKDVTRQKG